MITINEIIDRGENYEMDFNLSEDGATVHVHQMTPKQSLIDYIVGSELNKCVYIDVTGDVFHYLLPVERYLAQNANEVIKEYLTYHLL